MAQPATFRLEPSLRLALMLACSALGGMGSVVVTAGSRWWSVLACAAALAVLRHVWRTQAARSARAAVSVVGVDEAGDWWLATRSGGPRAVRFTNVCVQRWAIVATCIDDAGGRYPLVIAADALSGDQFRCLRARLRMQVLASAGAGGATVP